MQVTVTVTDACGYPTEVNVTYTIDDPPATLRSVLAEEKPEEEKLTKRFWLGRILDR